MALLVAGAPLRSNTRGVRTARHLSAWRCRCRRHCSSGRERGVRRRRERERARSDSESQTRVPVTAWTLELWRVGCEMRFQRHPIRIVRGSIDARGARSGFAAKRRG